MGSPDQPRDSGGRWSAGSAGGAADRAYKMTQGMRITDSITTRAHSEAAAAHNTAASAMHAIGRHEIAKEHEDLADAHRAGMTATASSARAMAENSYAAHDVAATHHRDAAARLEAAGEGYRIAQVHLKAQAMHEQAARQLVPRLPSGGHSELGAASHAAKLLEAHGPRSLALEARGPRGNRFRSADGKARLTRKPDR